MQSLEPLFDSGTRDAAPSSYAANTLLVELGLYFRNGRAYHPWGVIPARGGRRYGTPDAELEATMTDDFNEKPADKGYARARLAELKAMLKVPVEQRSSAASASTASQQVEAIYETPYEPFRGSVEDLIGAFEDAVEHSNGIEYWSSRTLMPLLGYGEYWQNFEKVVVKAQMACHQSGQLIADHFSDVTNMVEVGSGALRAVKDTRVTRYGAYLIAQNGDSRKKQVAFAQTYFAIQTRKQEISDEVQQPPLTEEQRRIMLRDEMITHNKKLVSAAKSSGVEQPLDFAVFQNHGYKGLYGGLDRRGIQSVKGLSAKADILDHMGSTELAANLFRATQTEEKLRREQIQGKQNANDAHYEVGRQVRKAIRDIGGTMPEKLEAAEDIGKVRRRLAKPSSKEIE